MKRPCHLFEVVLLLFISTPFADGMVGDEMNKEHVDLSIPASEVPERGPVAPVRVSHSHTDRTISVALEPCVGKASITLFNSLGQNLNYVFADASQTGLVQLEEPGIPDKYTLVVNYSMYSTIWKITVR